MPNFTKIGSLGVELFHADGRTDGQDMTTVVCSHLANVPKDASVITVLASEHSRFEFVCYIVCIM